MHSYVVVAAKPGRAMPPQVTALIDGSAPIDLAFRPDAHVRWSDDNGRLVFGGWQAFTHVAQLGSHWHRDARGITSFSGRMWPHASTWEAGRSWGEQLSDRWRRAPFDKVGQPFDGIFTALTLNADGTGEVVNDPLSLATIYRAENEDIVAFSNRAALAARAVCPPDRQPERDPVGCGWMVYTGYLLGDRTGFTRVRVLPLGSYVELHPRFGSRVRTANPTPWVRPDGLPDDPAELVELVHQDLARRVESATALPSGSPRVAELTGGRDSRLILALLMEGGLTDRVRFHTTGADTTPDRIVATELAGLCGIEHHAIAPGGLEEPVFLRRLQIHSFQTAGTLNAWDLMGGTGMGSRLTMCGLFGEVLRTAFAKYPPLSTSAELLDAYLSLARVDTLNLLRPEVRAEYLRVVTEELVERCDAESGGPWDRLDSFYVRNRLRRQPGFTEEVGYSGRVYPLYSLLGYQAAFALGQARRHDEYLPFHVMKAACPMLAEHRFAGSGWRDSLLDGEVDGDRYRATPCTGPPPDTLVPAAEPWQKDRFERHRDVIEGYLLGDPENPLFEVVDRDALTAVLTGPLKPAGPALYQVYGALAGAVWLGHHETPIPVGTAAADLPPPAPLPAPAPPPDPPAIDLEPSTVRRLTRRLPGPVRRALRLVMGRRR